MNWRPCAMAAAIAALASPCRAGELNHYLPGIFGTRDFFQPPEPGLYYTQLNFNYLSDEFHDGSGNAIDQFTIARSLDVTQTFQKGGSFTLAGQRRSSFSINYEGSTLNLDARIDSDSTATASLAINAEAIARLRARAVIRTRLEDLDVRMTSAVPSLVWASAYKFLGARVGALVALPIVDMSIDASLRTTADVYARVDGQLTVRALATLTGSGTVNGSLTATGPNGGSGQVSGSRNFTAGASRAATVKRKFNSSVKLHREYTLDVHDSRTDIADLYVQPLWLNWSGDHYDLSLADGFWAPTGHYEPGALDNTGMGFWTNQTQVAAAWYPWKSKGTALTTAVTYEVHSNKEGADIRPGDTLTVNWGLSQFLPLNSAMTVLADLGVGGYDLFQVSNDRGSDVTYDASVHDEVHAFGVQLGLVQVKWGAALTLRWMREYAARDRFQGDMYVINFAKKL